MARSSPRFRSKGFRRLSAPLATAVAAAGITFFVAPASAWALGPGKMCLYLAPSGAQAGPIALGHVGWEFQESGRGYWAGATEQGTGKPVDTWILSSPSETTIHGYFKNELTANGKVQHYVGYYLYYRCHSTPSSSVGAALAEARSLENGYNILTNNCLTKSVAIFNSYYSGDVLWPGLALDPEPTNFFFYFLPLVGWGPVHDL